MNVNDMRDYIALAYPGPKWHKRVALMDSRQVIAIYHNMIERSPLNRPASYISNPQKTPTSGRMQEQAIQMTIWDIPGLENL